MRHIAKTMALSVALWIIQQPSPADSVQEKTSDKTRNFDCTSEVIPQTSPFWIKAESIVKEFPDKKNLVGNSAALSSWCQNTEEQITHAFRRQEAWNRNVKNTSCTFLVGDNGDIQDAFICSGIDATIDPFVLSVISKAGPFASRPTYLANRRLNLHLNYPTIELLVDAHEHADDKKYFEEMKARSERAAVRTQDR